MINPYTPSPDELAKSLDWLSNKAAGSFTAGGIEQMIGQAGIQAQRYINQVQEDFLAMQRHTIMPILADAYAPKTICRQFRFPRSKKQRIRKKWAKDRRNWRDENVVFLFSTKGLNMIHGFTVPSL